MKRYKNVIKRYKTDINKGVVGFTSLDYFISVSPSPLPVKESSPTLVTLRQTKRHQVTKEF